jgi:hypothetical protein
VKKNLFSILFLLISLGFLSQNAFACDSCLCSVLGRRDTVTSDTKEFKPVFFDFLFEQQNWNELPILEAHDLHMQGHHVHNKTREEFYHFQAGVNPHPQVTILADIPYVVRGSIEVEEHPRLGQKQVSEGWGDLNLIGIWRFIQNTDGFLGVTGGVKFPTGATNETKPDRDLVSMHAEEDGEELELDWEKYELELQPGTGSYDFPIGGVFRYIAGQVIFKGNVVYTIKTKGAREFEFGDVFTTSLVTDIILNPDSSSMKTSVGLDINFQHQDKQTDHGREVTDSGGDILFVGPSLTIEVNPNSQIYGTFLLPVSQRMGGVHQDLDFIWTAGAKLSW